MAVPRRKVSKWARDKRRSHLALTPMNFSKCENCSASRLPHSICDFCGFYKGRKVYETKFAPMLAQAQAQQAAALAAPAAAPTK